MDKTHIDNTIEKILVYVIDLQSEKNPNSWTTIEQLKGLLGTLIQSESKRYADERVMEFAKYVAENISADVGAIFIRKAGEWLNQNTEPSNEDKERDK